MLVELPLQTIWRCRFSVTVTDRPVNRIVTVKARSAAVASILAEQAVQAIYRDRPFSLTSIELVIGDGAAANQITDDDETKIDIHAVGWDFRRDRKDPWIYQQKGKDEEKAKNDKRKRSAGGKAGKPAAVQPKGGGKRGQGGDTGGTG